MKVSKHHKEYHELQCCQPLNVSNADCIKLDEREDHSFSGRKKHNIKKT